MEYACVLPSYHGPRLESQSKYVLLQGVSNWHSCWGVVCDRLVGYVSSGFLFPTDNLFIHLKELPISVQIFDC